jgi:hypothetical protein
MTAGSAHRQIKNKSYLPDSVNEGVRLFMLFAKLHSLLPQACETSHCTPSNGIRLVKPVRIAGQLADFAYREVSD